ncbi:MAG: aminoglycoside phosphotransferase family protein [Catenulispora sp.]|nr:aminoglycoside phosphotransferase family protein [Catenulispora sp.]
MNDALSHAIQSLRWEIGTDAIELTGSASGASVYRVQAAGEDAILKVTGPGNTRQLARRELAFYRIMADRIPVRIPRLLRYTDNEDITALLLSAHPTSPPAREWSKPTWLELARQLAELHSLSIPSGDRWLGTSWLRQALDQPPLDLAEGYWSNTSAASNISLVLGRISELAAAFKSVPDCFVHGDCHVDNLLREDGELVWADWQSVGVGNPAGELAFLWSRADADDADLPYEAMLDVYLAHRDTEPAPFRRALIAAEICILLFGWPHYAAYREQHAQDRIARRLIHLINCWLSGAA